MRVILDMDGVLVDFLPPILKRHGIINPYTDPDHLGNYYLPEVCGMKDEEFWRPFDDEDFWAGLEWTMEGKEILRVACDVVGEQGVYVSSRPCPTFVCGNVRLSHKCIAGKMRWMEENMPRFTCRAIYGVPKQLCAAPHRVLIDDCDHNVELFRKKGGGSILVGRPWNSGWQEEDKCLETVWRELTSLKKFLDGVNETYMAI